MELCCVDFSKVRNPGLLSLIRLAEGGATEWAGPRRVRLDEMAASLAGTLTERERLRERKPREVAQPAIIKWHHSQLVTQSHVNSWK